MNSGVVLFGSLSAATAGLGIWQLQRYYWKVDLIQKNEELFSLPLEQIGEMDNLRFVESYHNGVKMILVYQRN
jgi:cytochrome oxidase assembly protein ShyY1